MKMKIALTGGIACGKSTVAQFLNELGVETIDADDIVHELIPDTAERRRLAAEVFADPEKRKALEARLHPLVKERIRVFLGGEADNGRQTTDNGRGHLDIRTLDAPGPENQTIKQSNNQTILLAVIPLLFETHWDAEYDIICCVRSARATQVARMMTTRGYTREEAEARLAAQMSVEEKASKSHYVIDNDGSVEELKAKVTEFVAWLNQTIEQSSNRTIEQSNDQTIEQSSNRTIERSNNQTIKQSNNQTIKQ